MPGKVGQLSKILHHTSHRGGVKSQLTNQYPLRKIIRLIEVPYTYDGKTIYFTRELLECGHAIPIRQDMFGHTIAMRRRCKHCTKS